MFRKIVRYNLSALLFHVKTDKARRSADFEYAPAVEVDSTGVLAYASAQIPLPLHEAIARQHHRVVKVACPRIIDHARFRIELPHRRLPNTLLFEHSVNVDETRSRRYIVA